MPELHVAPLAESRQDTEHPFKSKAFYGWWIVFAGTLILSVSSGIGFYGHGVFLDPLRTLHGWPKATISSAITLYFLTAGIMGMIIGRQIDQRGPRAMIVVIAALLALSSVYMGLVQNAVMLGLGFVLIRMLGQNGMTMTSSNAMISV